ncbi:LacI family transcriptional regulator [Haematobacter massiliensis]|uniref:LacI family transcriptional regulator n=1 Tax=Haematobacter massiliensis TaxID=195105 RepID=A0A086Y6T0_9RHOB|nr:LacI family DNA-binding transcriptional regulator [Haematobacter massiliensis]KFI29980.1 LacI family transcriptional regulator [Haematobacter massiliensis]OWJ69425.1 LacI family transcriptional regulator [Haematobacter massiliensis]OWJ86918.1 LacI family transcriptional regulator [Haematobacter massiliensis]QBJ25487.1 LacI family DNA-binding transcriptional regulator [Haematobacter massiliensis]
MKRLDGDSFPGEEVAQRRRPTIYDLASLAGTSPSAVSAVLNGSWKKRRISKGLADRINRVAEEQGYAVNRQASALRSARSGIVGMIVPKYDNRYFGAIAEQFEAGARQRGLFPVITCTQRDPELELEAARELLSYQVDCLVATGATDPDRIAELCAASGVRTVNLDLPGLAAPSVVSDNFGGARDLTHLILRRTETVSGRRRPLMFLGGRRSDHNTLERIRGFRAAHEAAGIPLQEAHILPCGYAADKVERALDVLEGPLADGIFVNSTIALEGVVRWLKKRGTDPEACLFGCFDWDPFAALLKGNVGMVRQDVPAMLTALFALLDGKAKAPQIVVPVLMEPVG